MILAPLPFGRVRTDLREVVSSHAGQRGPSGKRGLLQDLFRSSTNIDTSPHYGRQGSNNKGKDNTGLQKTRACFSASYCEYITQDQFDKPSCCVGQVDSDRGGNECYRLNGIFSRLKLSG